MKRIITASILVLAAGIAPAHAETVQVTLDVSALEPIAHVEYANCKVAVAQDANGIAVLAAAKSAGCIDSYQITTTSFGPYVSCIDDICDGAATYWRMSVNGSYSAYGVADFKATASKVLGFSYTQWVTCLADSAAC